MMRGFTGVLAVFFVLASGSVYAQSAADSIPHPFNLDSLSEGDRVLLDKYKDVFEDDFHDFLDIFN